ncbi:MAG: VOC family protein [Streptomycetaceae bacterium]|nr:VOC family protein [Streptomycetaceae bacterium]
MATMIFVNLPVQDLERSKTFYTALGYSINPQFTDENAASIVISDTIVVMLLNAPFFKQFTKKDVVDANKATEQINALSVDSREEADRLTELAFAAGGSPSNDPMDMGPMYSRSFQDPDGHLWELVYMDPSAVQG